MDRLSQLRDEAGGSRDSTLDTTSPPSEAYMTANENSKYFSLSDSTFDIAPIKDVSLASTSANADRSTTDDDELISNLSPIGKKELIDSYKIGKQIEAANILSGGVDIFDDNENSFDGNELVIDDNVEADDKSNDMSEAAPVVDLADVAPIESIAELDPPLDQPERELVEPESELVEPEPEPELVEPEPELVEPEPELVEQELEVEPEPELVEQELEVEQELVEPEPELVEQELEVEPEANVANRETEVILQIDGNNVNAINIGNGLYLYRRDGQEELAAIQIIDDNDPQHNFKFLKVRYNAEGNLEVYEEIEIEVPKEVATKEGKPVDKNNSHMPIVDTSKATSGSSNSKVEIKNKSPQKEPVASTSKCGYREEKETSPESRTELNLNGKMMKFSESRKSPVVGTFTPMTYHSTPNKEGKPITKTMVDFQLHPKRHSDNVKKTIEVHTENVKQKSTEKEKVCVENAKTGSLEKEILPEKSNTVTKKSEIKEKNAKKLNPEKQNEQNQSADSKVSASPEVKPKSAIVIDKEKDTIARKLVLELQKTDSKSHNQGSAEAEMKLDKFKTENKKVVPINIKESDVVLSKPEKPALSQPSTSNTATVTTIESSKCVQTIERSEKALVESNKSAHINIDAVSTNKKNETAEKRVDEPDKSVDVPIDINLVSDNSKGIDEPLNRKNEVVGGKVKEDTAINVEKVENINIEKLKEASKNNPSEMIEVTNISSNHKPMEENSISSIKSVDDIMKFPLETFTDVSSSSINMETEESKAESITLYAIDTDESVSLITPSSASKTKEEISNIDNTISEVLTKISNTNNTVIENTVIINKQVPEVPPLIIKECTFEAKDGVDSTPETAIHASCFTKSPEKPKAVVEKINNQKVKNVEDTIKPTIPGLSEKAATSVPVPKITPSEKTVPSISISVLKPSLKSKPAIPIPQVQSSEKVSPSSDSAIPKLKPVPEVKSSEKGACPISMPGTKPLDIEVIPAPGINASEKRGRYVTAPGPKVSEKASQSTLKSEAKPFEKTFHSTPKPSSIAKPSEKVANSTSLPEVKPIEITTTSNKTVKSDSHVPVVTIAKPSSKLMPPVAIHRNEVIKKANDNPKEISKTNAASKNKTQIKTESREIKEPINKSSLEKPINHNHSAAVPFGKWTDVNRQEFLNKFKEVKAPVNINSKQIKNSNDLNRRDVLQKIDSQRAQTIINNATAKAQEKANVKNEAVFSSKALAPKIETKIPVKSENVDKKSTQVTKSENPQKAVVTTTVPTNLAVVASVSKTEPAPRDLSTATMASLIDKTIEDMINRVVPSKNVADESIQVVKINTNESEPVAQIPVSQEISKPDLEDSVSLDDIEMKMNELHGIPFVERPPHELPKIPKTEIKTYNKTEKVKILSKVPITLNVTSSSELKVVKENVIDIDSDEEVIEHEPITGDLQVNNKSVPIKVQDKKPLSEKSAGSVVSKDAPDKEPIITEKDFDKFVRRNSVSCENYLTVNFDHKEQQNVHITKEKDCAPQVNPKFHPVRNEVKSKLPHKQTMRHNIQTPKIQGATKFGAVVGDSSNKKYQSKIHSAYQSALTAKHQVACPITIIEDKPVKVVFVESSTGFVPSQLNVQGQELSPSKKSVAELDSAPIAGNDSLDSDVLETTEENKQQDKTKTKHQRKQVLTPVEAPELELIQPCDIGLETSPKKKRKIEDTKTDKQSKNLVHKKSYLLGRNTTTEDKTENIQVLPKDTPKDIVNRSEDAIDHKDTASAIDNLVKAAELLENQAGTLNKTTTTNPESQPNTPVKRGRGRPRKYPLPEGATESKTPSPQKKPRLIDAKPVKQYSISDEHDEDSSEEEEMIRENWTMGKINENIVCPICNKLFRSENVVFKHVKHCTGVSPNRSDSDKSPRRSRLSQESEDMDMDHEISFNESNKNTPKKRRSKDKAETKLEQTNVEVDKVDVIIIEDLPVKEKSEKQNIRKEDDPKKVTKAKIPHRVISSNSLICEFCGKTFRQLSYLVNHKLQHKKEQTKETEKDAQNTTKLQVFSCEVCKKEFRKLHHLVQHRIIHNPDFVPKRSLRKSSSEQNGTKNAKDDVVAKQNEDASAAFRCEPCDKSFRKLHHLVEHRETHDGINRQKPSAPSQPTVEKPPPPPQCEICKKTFRKLHHLIEHKEQHADTSSEKSDDKSVKSALSTKDIIHECSLCYMVFPNEHSLTKHSANCSKKKRQSKQPKDLSSENESAKDENNSEEKEHDLEQVDAPIIVAEEIIVDDEKVEKEQDVKVVEISPEVERLVEVEKVIIKEIKQTDNEKATHSVIAEKPMQILKEVKSTELQSTPAKRDLSKSNGNKVKEKSVIPEKIKKIDLNEVKPQDIPKNKTLLKDKVALAVTKRQKTNDAPLMVADKEKPVESSDDEVRYMFNPNFKVDELNEGKLFMKVRASKRNSLQIERPISKDFVKRRTSLQHPPKATRLKIKALKPKLRAAEPKPKAPESNLKSLEPKLPTTSKHIPKKSEVEATLSTDSDDSDVKYSFPKTAPETSKSTQERKPKEIEKKVSRKSLTEKRKSLAGIAKRKSLGKAITTKHKQNASPAKPIKKRTTEVEHRCDCGQLFSSAALLARHTSLAHTPPRIRRRRSPPPDAPAPKPLRNSTQADKPKPAVNRKSSVRNEMATTSRQTASTRKSSVKADATAPLDTRKSDTNKSEVKTAAKTRRSAAHAVVPVPAKTRKLMQRNK